MTYTFERVAEKTKVSVSTDGKIVRTHTRSGIVRAGEDVSTNVIAANLGLIPGAVHPSDTGATLRDIDVDRKLTKGTNAAFDVVLQYSTDAPQPDNNDDDPTTQKVKRSQGSVEQTFYIIKDKNGVAIVNAAGQPPAGGIPVSVQLPTFVYEKNIKHYDRNLVAQWMNALNDDTFNGCAAKTLKLNITADEQFEGKTSYWAHRFEMAFNPLGWQPSYVNAGLMQVTTLAEGLLKPIIDPHTKQPVTEPWPLYAEGHANEGKALPAGYAPGDVNFIAVEYFNEKDYSELGLKEF
jgi:hypothetical protein